jgi:hypothetical protein
VRLATFDDQGWQLESGEARHFATPDSFEIPPLEDRDTLSAGEMAKLLFQVRYTADDGREEVLVERMWVVVQDRSGKQYRGILLNNPAGVEPDEHLQVGVQLAFEPAHVIDIRAPDSRICEQYGITPGPLAG